MGSLFKCKQPNLCLSERHKWWNFRTLENAVLGFVVSFFFCFVFFLGRRNTFWAKIKTDTHRQKTKLVGICIFVTENSAMFPMHKMQLKRLFWHQSHCNFKANQNNCSVFIACGTSNKNMPDASLQCLPVWISPHISLTPFFLTSTLVVKRMLRILCFANCVGDFLRFKVNEHKMRTELQTMSADASGWTHQQVGHVPDRVEIIICFGSRWHLLCVQLKLQQLLLLQVGWSATGTSPFGSSYRILAAFLCSLEY